MWTIIQRVRETADFVKLRGTSTLKARQRVLGANIPCACRGDWGASDS